MTITSMYQNSVLYTEKVDEFIILRYTIASGRCGKQRKDQMRINS